MPTPDQKKTLDIRRIIKDRLKEKGMSVYALGQQVTTISASRLRQWLYSGQANPAVDVIEEIFALLELTVIPAPPAVTASSGNVFADLGLPGAEEYLEKARLVIQIIDLLAARKLTRAKSAALLGLDKDQQDRLIRGHLDEVSTDQLRQFITTLKEGANP